MRRLALTFALALVLPGAAQARPAKRRPARRPAAVGAPAPTGADASSIQATPG